ncbi:MAG TPA: FAD-dependent oxidoreductase [Mucilaginibacter sp.]|jgi:phytoene dehydrogenase-like protein|nr:FAD-dependent oxidoreductase [Mucilaginibacter sp.]
MQLEKRDFDAIVVGSGPNGLAAAILMQQKGLSVLLIEGKETVGGGLRSAELTLPGFVHDICSAVHPLAVASPFFETLPLSDHGLEYIYPEIAAAHPFDNGSVAILKKSLEETALLLGTDEQAYLDLMQPIVKDWPSIAPDVLGPLHYPKHPLAMARFGLSALTSATWLSKKFKTPGAKALFAGMAAHAIQPLSNLTTSAIALVLMASAHLKGWPIPKRGSNQIANALASYFVSLGGKIETNYYVKSLEQLPSAHAVLFDVTPRQLLQIAGHRFSSLYKWQLERYRYGMGVFKIDWALDAPIPFTATGCRGAGTVHIGNTFEEIAACEQQVWNGTIPEKPFVLLSQPSVFDPSRAPEGKHTAWAYCHVPNGSKADMTAAIENQVERFAPGFKETILARHTMDTAQMEEYNPNYIGGDINGGVIDIGQLFTRPVLRWSPYKTSAKGIYICSSSTPPGGGVHGMCGYHAAKKALRDVFDH